MIGQHIGPYEVIQILGQGGMGIVYLGLHTKLEQYVAIKVLSPEFCENATMRERFVQEAKLQAKLAHPNVVNILNYLEDSRNIYLVMEYIRGETLDARLRRTGALPVSECCHITLEVLNALAFMHRQGIIHRDIKPSNIMLTDSGQVKVTDFGVAKIGDNKGLTKTGTRLGTVWYMSPEQIRGAKVDAASDIYALGVTLFQMATGQLPFNSESDFDIMRAHIEEPPPNPESLNPQIPTSMTQVIFTALAKDPQDRYHSAEDFKTALLQTESQFDDNASDNSRSQVQELTGSNTGQHFSQPDVGLLYKGPDQAFLIFGQLEKKTFLFLAAMAFMLIIVLIYFLLYSGLFRKEKIEQRQSIPLTTIGPGSFGISIPAEDKLSVRETEGEDLVKKNIDLILKHDTGLMKPNTGEEEGRVTHEKTPIVYPVDSIEKLENVPAEEPARKEKSIEPPRMSISSHEGKAQTNSRDKKQSPTQKQKPAASGKKEAKGWGIIK